MRAYLIPTLLTALLLVARALSHTPFVLERDLVTGLEDSEISKIFRKYTLPPSTHHHRSENQAQALTFDGECHHDEFADERVEWLVDTERQTSHQKRDIVSYPIPAMAKPHPINIVFNTTYLLNDVGRSCYSAKQIVSIGSNPRSSCSSTLTYNCYYQCTADDVVTVETANYITNTVLPALRDLFSSLLSVRKTSTTLLLDQKVYQQGGKQCDVGLYLPSEYVQGGPGLANADYLLYITARPFLSSDTLAAATACNVNFYGVPDEPYGRPLAGFIQFSPANLNRMINAGMTEYRQFTLLRLAAHEVSHALGFNRNLYSSYVDVETGIPMGDVTKFLEYSGKSPAGDSYQQSLLYITTPAVRDFATRHYGCEHAPGVPTEDYGGEGTAGSHWESRVATNEYMLGYSNPVLAITNLTLSLFESMGWYTVNKSKAEPLTWAKGTGCAVVGNAKCPPTTCNVRSTQACSSDLLGKGTCNLREYNGNLPAFYQHYGDRSLGGSFPPADYCAYTRVEVYCTNASVATNSPVGEVYSSASRCFSYSSMNNTQNLPGCFQFRCMDDANILQVNVQNSWYTCDDNTGSITTDAGLVVRCPAAWALCNSYPAISDTFVYDENSSASTLSHAAGSALLLLSLLLVL